MMCFGWWRVVFLAAPPSRNRAANVRATRRILDKPLTMDTRFSPTGCRPPTLDTSRRTVLIRSSDAFVDCQTGDLTRSTWPSGLAQDVADSRAPTQARRDLVVVRPIALRSAGYGTDPRRHCLWNHSQSRRRRWPNSTCAGLSGMLRTDTA